MENRGQISAFVNENPNSPSYARGLDKTRSKSQENFECG